MLVVLSECTNILICEYATVWHTIVTLMLHDLEIKCVCYLHSSLAHILVFMLIAIPDG